MTQKATKRREVTKEQAIEELRELFGITEEFEPTKAMEKDGRFHVNKQYMERFLVIEKLQEYFSINMFVPNYYLEVDSITFVTTAFEIKEGNPYEKK